MPNNGSELNQQAYENSYQTLTSIGIPKPLADAASRVIATDDPTQPNLGRNDADVEVCRAVADVVRYLPDWEVE